MQPHDQDELRRRAQEVLARRIAPDTDDAPPPSAPEPPERARPAQRRPREFDIPVEQLPDRSELERRSRDPREEVPRERVFEVPVEVLPDRSEPEPPPPNDLAPRRQQRQPTRTISSRALQRDQIRRAIHDPAAVRQAIVLTEILGKPVALREQGDSETSGVV